MSEWPAPPITYLTPRHCALSVDIEYDNGLRETVTVKDGEPFTVPFNGKIVAMRPE